MRLVRDDSMRIKHYPLPLLAWIAWLGIGSFALSAEGDVAEKIKISAPFPSGRSNQEAYGLLVNRYPKSVTARNDTTEDDEIVGPSGQQSIQTASLVTMIDNGSGPSATQLPAPNEPAPSYLSDSGACSVCDCCNPLWCYRNSVFVDFLYLRPGNIDYIYAVEQTGTLPTDSPTGPVGRVGFDGAPGYRLGFNYALSDCSGIQASYTWFQDGTSSAINAAPGTVLIFQPGLPSIPNVGAASVAASARYDIRFQQLDLDYRGL